MTDIDWKARAEEAEAERDEARKAAEMWHTNDEAQLQRSRDLSGKIDITAIERDTAAAEASDLKAQVAVLFQCITKAATLLDPRSLDAAELKIVIGDLLKSEAFDAARAKSKEGIK